MTRFLLGHGETETDKVIVPAGLTIHYYSKVDEELLFSNQGPGVLTFRPVSSC